MTNYSRAAQRQLNATSGEAPVYLVEINQAGLAEPVRLVCDNQDLTSNGNLYVACQLRLVPPDDFSGQLSRSTLAVDNIGKELTTWLEASGGGRGATVTIRTVMRATPNVYEREITMDLTNLNVDWREVSGQLGFEDILNKPSVQIQFRPETAPGLFV